MLFLTAARKQAHAGFTLIELVIVMTIIVIGFFAVRPAFSGALRNAQRRAMLREMVSLLIQARTEAVGSGKLVRLLCDPDQGTLSLEVQVDPAQDRSEFEPLPVTGREVMSLPPDYSVTGLEIGGMDVTGQGPGAVYYYPDGSNDGLVLKMEGATGQQAVIEVLPATGKVNLNA